MKYVFRTLFLLCSLKLFSSLVIQMFVGDGCNSVDFQLLLLSDFKWVLRIQGDNYFRAV